MAGFKYATEMKVGIYMEKEIYQHAEHTFSPVFDEHSRILILGTFPSVKSRENHFYYGHPQNRFWRVLALVMEDAVPETIEEKKRFLLKHCIAVWDVVASCDIIGSSDSSIRNVVPTDLSRVLEHAPIRRIYANGTRAAELFWKYSPAAASWNCCRLPSTSPANASFRLDRLAQAWHVIRNELVD